VPLMLTVLKILGERVLKTFDDLGRATSYGS